MKMKGKIGKAIKITDWLATKSTNVIYEKLREKLICIYPLSCMTAVSFDVVKSSFLK